MRRQKLEASQSGLLDDESLDIRDILTSAVSRVPMVGGLLAEIVDPPEANAGASIIYGPEREENFRRWFADSKIVDEEGKPLVVYHGTDRDFDSFKPAGRQDKPSEEALAWFRDRISKNKNIPLHSWRMGSFFSPKPEYTDSYTNEGKGMVYPVYLKAENPAWHDNVEKVYKVTNPKKTPDALIIHHDGDINEIVVPDPTQIKSIYNRGTFDPEDPDILSYREEPIGLLSV